MKKFFRGMLAALACFGLILLVSCSNVSQSYADKINNAAKDGEAISLDQVRKDLGDDRAEIIFAGSGAIIAVKGCKNLEDIKTKVDNGDDVEGIIVTILLNKATAAEYRKITASDLK